MSQKKKAATSNAIAIADGNNADTNRITNWRKRSTSAKTKLRYKQSHSISASEEDNSKKEINIIADIDKSLTPLQQHELHAAVMCAATGTASIEYGQMLFSEAINIIAATSIQKHDASFIANSINDALISLKPQDELEGMLCIRLIALHAACMKFMRNSAVADASTDIIDANINRATKLMRLYNETLEALNRHRRKGEQKVTVQHINVTNHGQAVVGNKVVTGGGGNDKS